MPSHTQSESRVVGAGGRRQAPGALLVFSGNQPLCARIDLAVGEAVWGRNDLSGIRVADSRMSQTHLKIRWDAKPPGATPLGSEPAGSFKLFDVGSRHGTFVNGERIPAEREVTANDGDVVRMGRTLVILLADVSEYRGTVETPQGTSLVIGPRMRVALDLAASARERGVNLLILGENGAGKEMVARHYHGSAKRPGPWEPVNCANLKNGTAATQLFGAAAGVFTEVKAHPGLIGLANGGVLFLDEIAELDEKVQPDFLRVLEDKKYRVTGGKEETPVEINVVAASHQSLRDRVANGQFRKDLFYRLSQEPLELPPLRERREEMAFLMALETTEGRSALHYSAVEHALLLPWPGNLRELRNATASAVAKAVARFAAEAPARRLEGIKPADDGPAEVRREDFAPDAGCALGLPPPVVAPSPKPNVGTSWKPLEPVEPSRAKDPRPGEEVIRGTLEKNGFNVKRTAEELGLHRTQLSREMKKFGIKRPDGAQPEADDESPDDAKKPVAEAEKPPMSPSGTLHDDD
ncbi:MAG: sigma 54-interacting transcriptional regulator [Archangium sp.]|nr:sigma 54-interacting transcriptional regulator [Archangium sp.]